MYQVALSALQFLFPFNSFIRNFHGDKLYINVFSQRKKLCLGPYSILSKSGTVDFISFDTQFSHKKFDAFISTSIPLTRKIKLCTFKQLFRQYTIINLKESQYIL